METDEPAGGALEALLRLQDVDLEIDRLGHRRAHLEVRGRIEAAQTERAQRQRVIAGIEADRVTLKEKEGELEREIAAVRDRRAAIDARLSSAESGSFRDQEAMATEMGALTERMADLEDVELEVLEQLEPLETELATLLGEIAHLDESLGTLGDELASDEAAVDAEIGAALERRASLAADVPEALATEYERLRAHLGGIGAARLEHGACSGCHLSIPATDLDRMRRAEPGTVFHCEQCGRILVGP